MGYDYYGGAEARYKKNNSKGSWYLRAPGKGNKSVFNITDTVLLYYYSVSGASGVRPVITVEF